MSNCECGYLADNDTDLRQHKMCCKHVTNQKIADLKAQVVEWKRVADVLAADILITLPRNGGNYVSSEQIIGSAILRAKAKAKEGE